MKNIKYLIIYSSILCSLAACEKEIKFNGELQQPLLSLHAECNTGEDITCFVGKSQFFLDKNKDFSLTGEKLQYRINNGNWMVMEKNSGIDDMVYTNAYKAFYKIKPGDKIDFNLYHPEYPNVHTSQIAPEKYEPTKINTYCEDDRYLVNIVFDKRDNTKNLGKYLSISLTYHIGNNYHTLVDNAFSTEDSLVIFKYKDLNQNALTNNKNKFYNIIIPIDELTNGYKLELIIYKENNNTYDLYNTQNNDNDDKLKMIMIEATSLSDDAYKYKKSCELYRANNGNPFAEKTQIFSNINGGLGIFIINSTFKYNEIIQ